MVVTKREFKFLLIFTFSLCFFASATASAKSKDFDYFWFIQEWRPSICKSLPSTVNCVSGNKFGIYGLWPEFENGSYPIYCNGPAFDLELVTGRLLDLLWEYWPGTYGYPSSKYWKEAWDKYGVCSNKELNQTEYFEKATTMITNFDILNILSRFGIKPTSFPVYYTMHTIKNVITAYTGKTPGLCCKKNTETGQSMLASFVMCYERDGRTLKHCPSSADRDCPFAFIWPSIVFNSGLTMPTNDQ